MQRAKSLEDHHALVGLSVVYLARVRLEQGLYFWLKVAFYRCSLLWRLCAPARDFY